MRVDCPSQTTLEAFASGNLAEGARAPLETHLEVCATCAQHLENITRTQLEQLVGSEGPRIVKRANPFLGPARTPGTLGTFAGYDVTEIAGTGGMGVVFKAHDPTLQRTVAIKVLSPSRAWDEESAARFLREARTIAAIQHDHVVVVHTAGREKGLPYLVMPFHAEGTLEQMLQRVSRLPPADVIRVGIQLARALEITHAQEILHRDIKPSNILLEGGLERVRLADFGLAQPATNTEGLAGTPQYMSPEQARGETIGARSDLFGLGAVLFRLARGETVYAGETSREILQNAAAGRVRELSGNVPPAVAQIINRLIAPGAEERYASAAEVVAALKRAASRYRRWLKRAAIITLAACLTFAAGIVVLDASGRTTVVNTLLSKSSGESFFIRGRFGTYPELVNAVEASRAGEIVEVRYSGERVTRNFRSGGKPLTIRAAKGFTPILYATNNAQPFILADGPLTLEGLTLMRWAKSPAFTALITAEDVPVALLNCRIFRNAPFAANLLIRSGKFIPLTEDDRVFAPLITLDRGSKCFMRNCLVASSQAAGIALRGEAQEPIKAEIYNSIFAIRRVFALRSVPGFKAQIDATGSVFVSEELLDLGNAETIQSTTLNWTDCVFDLSQGAFVRLFRHSNGEWLRAVRWKESNVVYAGKPDFVMDRKGPRINSDAEWQALAGLPEDTHIITDRHLFAGVVMRANPQVSAADANLAGLKTSFDAKLVGEGKAYDDFRADPEYDLWQQKMRAAMREWQQRER